MQSLASVSGPACEPDFIDIITPQNKISTIPLLIKQMRFFTKRLGVGHAICWKTIIVMECFFGSFERNSRNQDDKGMLVCFSIPDAGINFKAPFSGEQLHTDYASLLTLLEFIELNHKLFRGKELQIFGDNIDLIEQVNGLRACQYEFSALLKKALDYKQKYNFSLGWVPKKNNPSIGQLFD
jgi:hypothetical protein